MRFWVPLAVLLVVVALAVRMERLLPQHGEMGDQELNLLVFSRSHFQATMGDEPLYQRYQITDGVITLDEVYRFREAGLRATLFDKHFDMIALENFALAKDPSAAAAFLAFCAGRPDTSVLVLHHKGALLVHPDTPQATQDALGQAIIAMGGRHNPFESGRTSWCFIHGQSPQVNTPIAEAMGTDRNTHLAYTVTPQHLQKPMKTFYVEQGFEGPITLSLRDEIGVVSRQVGTIWVQPGAVLEGERHDAIRAMPPHDPEAGKIVPHQMVWAGVSFPEETTFQTRVALNPAARDKSDGVDFVVLFNNRELARLACPNDEAAFRWRTLEAQLPARETGTLVLKVDTREEGLADYAMWGSPTLHLGK